MQQYADQNFTTDILLSILANSRRRIVIRYLSDNNPVEMKELAEIISDIEDCSEKSAYAALNQTHVPKLTRADIIDQSNGTRSFTQSDKFARAKLILDYCDQL